MARGGKREGAGRPPGSLTHKTREIAAAALKEGISPLEFLLAEMRDEGNDPDVRRDAAKAAAPYCHARLQAIEANVTTTKSYEDQLRDLAGDD